MALYISNKHNKVSYTPSSEFSAFGSGLKVEEWVCSHPRVLKIEDENRSELRVLMLGQRRKKAYKLCNRASVVSIEFRTNLKHLQHIIVFPHKAHILVLVVFTKLFSYFLSFRFH